MNATPAVRQHPTGDVQQDWLAWLPDQSAQLFEQVRHDLTVSCVILGIIVNEALSALPDGAQDTSPQLAILFAGLFDRLVDHLGMVLSALEQHGRANGTRPNAGALRPENFRSKQARHLARTNQLHVLLCVTDRTSFDRKLGAIRRVLAGLQKQAREQTRQVAAGESRCAGERWAHLEILHYDLNTCLQETTVILKSFFCALPSSEVPLFRNRLPM